MRAGGDILRRATAMGLGGLAIALLVGVMSFAFTTRPAGQPQESVARYLTVPGRVVDLSTITTGAAHLTERAGMLIGPGGETVSTRRVNQRPLEMSLLGISQQPRVLAAERTPITEDGADGASAAIVAAPVEFAAGTEPALAPGDRVMATVSFYYCEPGTQGLHPGDGGNFCGVMRDGTVVYPGAAACAYAYLGQQFRIVGDPTGRVYRCADTGSAVHGLHRDIWFMSSDDGWAWQLRVGQVAEIEILP